MLTGYDPTYLQILGEAEDIAHKTGQKLTSAHVLLAMFVVPNAAGSYLLSRKINEDRILNVVQAGQSEIPGMVEQIKIRAAEYAKELRSRDVNPLHLLLAMCRSAESVANRLLSGTGVRMDQIRTNIFTIVTGGLRPGFAPRRENPLVTPVSPAIHVQPQVQKAARMDIPTDQLPPSVIKEDRRARKPAGGAAQEEEGGRDAGSGAESFDLPEKEYPLLCRLGRNITALAGEGLIDAMIGREKELGEVVDILGKRRTNNPILVGEPGVGKTALVEGLAKLLVESPGLVPSLDGKAVVELDMGRVMAGTQLRGALSERLNGIKEEVRKSDGRVIVFLDEIHQLMSGGAEGSEDAAAGLKSALARGEFPCIGATTNDEYSRFIESDPAFKRRFQMVLVPEPNFDETVRILQGILPEYERHHCVKYAPEALKAAATLSSRYIGDRYLPDKAISMIDLAGSRARREGRETVTEIEIASVVSSLARIPIEKLLMTDSERFLRMEELISSRIVGHSEAVSRVAGVIRRNYAGFGARRPIGSFIFLGPTGVGKTETVKALADFLFQSPDAMVRLDMSEYSEQHSTARLVGAPPGYVGFDAGGQLTEAVRRRPFIIVLLDEVEKAHRDVMQMFLQVLDDGRLTDGRGRTVDFSNTVVIMTSNLGNREFSAGQAARIGFGEAAAEDGLAEADSRVLEAAKAHFPPELWNRIDEKLVFRPLSREQIIKIAELQLSQSSKSLKAEKGISFEADQGAVECLLDSGGHVPELGARPMRQAIQRLVEAPIAGMILRGELKSGDAVRVIRGMNGLEFMKQD
jgi:ATP-dependent Clp protease ATP-binding subunit ClpC